MSQMPPAAQQPEKLTLHAADGYALAAVRYRAEGAERARIVVAGATGVPQGFYRRFAEYAAKRGFTVLTFDYRGIGQSAPASLRGFGGDFLDWARLDLAAAVEEMAQAGTPLYMVGHSYGGHAFGLLPNHHKVNALYTFATGAGWHGWMPLAERLRVLFMWRVMGPLMTRRHGFLSWSRLGMGEDLPLQVYRQWRKWCAYPRYFFDDPSMSLVTDGFSRVQAPIMAANARDDRWAPPASRDAFMAGYRNAPWFGVDIDPARSGLGKLGHMGYFRAHAEPLWRAALDWFEGVGEAPRRGHPPV
ncbi:alpha/beta hydrolase family protein [Massilia endophytica]|uniref:alpha/beta hydrolase family protein n=1 Tax=Massilia endophytica TaxID=2899220 RepID=UPI001E334C87|nr:alpha/beta fold hydrolase [Massilia endophytica]UGQ45193.1 alpha/beta fold hydrolase [Massilia endophytica]